MERFQRLFIEAELSPDIWTELPDIMQKTGIQCTSGLRSPDTQTMVASTGTMTFSLRNDKGCSGGVSHYYTPGHFNCLQGWEVGKRVRLVIHWAGERWIIWIGRIMIGGIQINADLYVPTVTVTARDYMEELAVHELVLPKFTTNKKMNEVVPLIIEKMPIKPLNVRYDDTATVFPTVFDTVWKKTRALEEINKLAKSELGYVYLRNEFNKPETLFMEGRNYRSTFTRAAIYGTMELDDPIETEDHRVLETEGGEILYVQHGWYNGLGLPLETEDRQIIQTEGGENIYLQSKWDNEWGEPNREVFANSARDITLVNGLDYLNYIKITTHPRKVDESNVELFSLNSPLEIPAGVTVIYNAKFVDPDQKAERITAMSTEAPVVSTDYNLSSDKTIDSGNLNAYCVLTRTYGADGFEDKITNNGTSTGYITKLKARGRGVYIYQAIGTVTKDDADILEHGQVGWDLDCLYLDDPFVAKDYLYLLRTKTFKMGTDIVTYTYVANKNIYKMQAFLMLTIGDIIAVSETDAGISNEYWIYGKDWVIGEGGITMVTYILRPAELDIYKFWRLDESALDTETVLGV